MSDIITMPLCKQACPKTVTKKHMWFEKELGTNKGRNVVVDIFAMVCAACGLVDDDISNHNKSKYL